MVQNYTVGSIIKMQCWHGVILGVFSDGVKTVLHVQTARNVFRRLGAEYIDVSLAPDRIEPATVDDLRREIANLREYQAQELDKLLGTIQV